MSSNNSYIYFSKTIVHAGNKVSSGHAAKVLESMLDKENVTEEDQVSVPSKPIENTGSRLQGNSKQNNSKKQAENQSKKRQLTDGNQSSQPEKRKKQDKSCRRKLLPQVKGQQSLAKFFRV